MIYAQHNVRNEQACEEDLFDRVQFSKVSQKCWLALSIKEDDWFNLIKTTEAKGFWND